MAEKHLCRFEHLWVPGNLFLLTFVRERESLRIYISFLHLCTCHLQGKPTNQSPYCINTQISLMIISPVSCLSSFCRLCHPKGFLGPQQWKRKAELWRLSAPLLFSPFACLFSFFSAATNAAVPSTWPLWPHHLSVTSFTPPCGSTDTLEVKSDSSSQNLSSGPSPPPWHYSSPVG